MWGKYGFRELIVNNGMYLFKFNNEEGLKHTLEKGHWMVMNKPLLVQHWNPSLCIEKKDPEVISLWIKLSNVPLEAWSNKGISVIAISVGKPVLMDQITTETCNKGIGRIGYVRVLVEIIRNGNYMNGNINVEYRPTNKKNIDLTQKKEDKKVKDKEKVNSGSDKRKNKENQSSGRWNVDKDLVDSVRRSANKYAIFSIIYEAKMGENQKP
nr:ATPase, F1/V1/A1 complex, alpha/beta subunit, zinc knuckle CX2CX4HX4C [Tanacetum cinerariifolium]